MQPLTPQAPLFYIHLAIRHYLNNYYIPYLWLNPAQFIVWSSQSYKIEVRVNPLFVRVYEFDMSNAALQSLRIHFYLCLDGQFYGFCQLNNIQVIDKRREFTSKFCFFRCKSRKFILTIISYNTLPYKV